MKEIFIGLSKSFTVLGIKGTCNPKNIELPDIANVGIVLVIDSLSIEDYLVQYYKESVRWIASAIDGDCIAIVLFSRDSAYNAGDRFPFRAIISGDRFVRCPYCQGFDFIRSRPSRPRQFRCKDCDRLFTVPMRSCQAVL